MIGIMEMRRTSESGALLRVAIKIDNNNYLQKLDVSQPMSEIIRDLCRQWGIQTPPEDLALWTVDTFISEGTKYMSDKNKYFVKPGSMLILKKSPQKKCALLMSKLLENHEEGLANIAKSSKDTEILLMLHSEKVHELVFSILVQNFNTIWWIDGMKFILQLYSKRLIKRVPTLIVKQLLITVGHGLLAHEELVTKSLKLLAVIRRFGRLYYTNELFDHLEILILLRDKPSVQEAALELLNFLALFPNNEKEETEAISRVVNKKIVGIISDSILRETPSKSMQQKLYQYETLVLRPYWTKKVTKVLNNDPEMEVVRRLTNRAKKGELIYRSNRRRLFSEGEKSENFLKNSKPFRPASTSRENTPKRTSITPAPSKAPAPVKNTLSPKRKPKWFDSCREPQTEKTDSTFTVDFSFPGTIFYVPLKEKPTMTKQKSASTTNLFESTKEVASNDPALSLKTYSQLTISNLKYQAAHYPNQYEQWALTKERKKLFAEKLTHLVCRLLDIGRPRPPDSPGDGYHPLLFFVYPYIEEELFCEVFALYEKTSREMKARVDRDVTKVLTVVSEQLSCALNPHSNYFQPGTPRHFNKPKSMEELRDIISLIHYQNIAEKRRREREERLRYDMTTKPLFLEYRHDCTPGILELIKTHRKRFARSGQHLLKVNAKGEVLSNSQEYLQLTKKGDQLIIGDCFKQPEKCNHSKHLPISEITDVFAGKQSKFYKDVFTQNEHWSKTRQQPKHWDCFFSLKLRDSTYVSFCAERLESMHYWTDAINLLLGKPMSSATMEAELQEFLDMSVRLKFLDIEELPLPDDAPALPPPPANYNFCLGPKNKPHKSNADKSMTLV